MKTLLALSLVVLSNLSIANEQTLTASFRKCEAIFYGQVWSQATGADVIICKKDYLLIHNNEGILTIKGDANRNVVFWRYLSGIGKEYDEVWQRGTEQ